MIGVHVKAALRTIENRNSLALSLLATGALMVSAIEVFDSQFALRTILVVVVAVVFTGAVWAAPRGRRAHGLSKRYKNAMSRRNRWPLMALGLIGCAAFPIGWFGVVGDYLIMLVAAFGFACMQVVSVALIFPLGRERRSFEGENDLQVS